MVLTTSQVNKAGSILRALLPVPSNISLEEFVHAREVLFEYRAAHRGALIKANNGLRSVVRTEGGVVQVSQRLKRAVTIVEKLKRQPTMALARMQDIAGCRAILRDVEVLRRVQKRLSRNRPPTKVDDYIITPRASGYRGVHLIVQYDERSIEVQLRTRTMHSLAVAVEQLGGRIDEDLKSGKGPAQVLELLAVISDAMAIEERGETVDNQMMDKIARLRESAQPYMEGTS